MKNTVIKNLNKRGLNFAEWKITPQKHSIDILATLTADGPPHVIVEAMIEGLKSLSSHIDQNQICETPSACKAHGKCLNDICRVSSVAREIRNDLESLVIVARKNLPRLHPTVERIADKYSILP